MLKMAVIALTVLTPLKTMPAEYTLLCEGRDATGFNWRNNDWVQTNFQTGRYLVSLKSDNKCLGEINSKLDGYSDEFKYRDVCLNIRNFGEEYHPQISNKCKEYYVFIDSYWESSFSCDIFLGGEFSGRFDGWFHKTTSIGNTSPKPKDGYKDSMVLEIGKCSRVS